MLGAMRRQRETFGSSASNPLVVPASRRRGDLPTAIDRLRRPWGFCLFPRSGEQKKD